MVEKGLLEAQDRARLVFDDRADEGPLVTEVVIDLRRADTRRLLDVFGAGACNAPVVHQFRRLGDDAIPGGLALPGDHRPTLSFLELTFQKSPSFLEVPTNCRTE